MSSSIIYEGQAFTLEWYEDERGKSQPRDYFNDLTIKRQRKALELFSIMGDIGEMRNITKFRNEGDGIYAFKPQPDRFLAFFFSGKRIIVTNAFEEKQNKMPKIEKEKALKIMKSWKEQFEKGRANG